MAVSQSLQIKNILAEAISQGAADLHFSVGNAPAMRLGGNLVEMADQAIITQEFMEDFIGILLSEEQRKKLEDRRELIITFDFDRNLRFKVNIFYQRSFLSATLRYIPAKVPTISALGLSPIVKQLAALDRGLIIVSGPFGSGRSTTAAAIIEEINQTRKKYIITIEDPIEYVFNNNQSIIEQRQIGQDTRSFVDALGYFEEENGDVLFVEEMEDTAVIPLVLEIARGGSLVISSLSAASASNTVARILDSFQSFDQERIRNLLATALKAVICQRLLPKIGGGSVVVQEIMTVNSAIQSIISSGSYTQIDDIIRTSRSEGMAPFDQELAQLVRDRIITREEALNNAADKSRMEEWIK
ncbi:MAG TPA: PilT/PilU family type 4a pilus ATPase [bacterium]|nr:PilT/PilU family type 4a pilus ATPase [bacterium]HPN81198.1 PilT/PilU family type 4a pilus ATPase [bacterium]HPW39495.1 PilT/PilU family type 4a pilus ATPase [bacterium]